MCVCGLPFLQPKNLQSKTNLNRPRKFYFVPYIYIHTCYTHNIFALVYAAQFHHMGTKCYAFGGVVVIVVIVDFHVDGVVYESEMGVNEENEEDKKHTPKYKRK